MGKQGWREKGKQNRHKHHLEDGVWRGSAFTSPAASLEVGVIVLFLAVMWTARYPLKSHYGEHTAGISTVK